MAILPWHNGMPTAVFEKHVTHQGVISSWQSNEARTWDPSSNLSAHLERHILVAAHVHYERWGGYLR